MAGSELRIVAPVLGDVVCEKYRLTAKIGAGGMGVVYEAMHLRLRQPVAIKFLLLPTSSSFSRGRFEREARVAARLRSANVVRVLDVDETDEGIPFIVMELLCGHDLGAEIAARGALPVPEAAGYALDAARALAEVHDAGIVHRDLKPSNIFLATTGGKRVLKVLDFGVSKVHDGPDEKLTTTDATLGTPHYMSPEQTRSSRSVDARSDVWSLGVIFYELLTGRLPFPGPGCAAAIAQIAADPLAPLPPGIASRAALERVLARALAKNVDERYRTMKELACALEELAASAAVTRTDDSTAPGAFATPISTRSTSMIAWTGIALVVALGIAAAAVSSRGRTKGAPSVDAAHESAAAFAPDVAGEGLAAAPAPSALPPTETAPTASPAAIVTPSRAIAPAAPKRAPRSAPLAPPPSAAPAVAPARSLPDPNPARL